MACSLNFVRAMLFYFSLPLLIHSSALQLADTIDSGDIDDDNDSLGLGRSSFQVL